MVLEHMVQDHMVLYTISGGQNLQKAEPCAFDKFLAFRDRAKIFAHINIGIICTRYM